jgi:steroid 5-alpha reductase family enzyme
MWDLGTYLIGLAIVLGLTTLLWLVSLLRRDASIIDLFWSVLFLVLGVTYAVATPAPAGDRRTLLLVLLAVWSIRLAGYLTWRNWGEEEDYRYQAMRRKAGASFPIRSLVTVFWLQAVLAWIVSAPLLAGVDADPALGWVDGIGVLFWVVGFFFESVGDLQLARFKANPDNRGKVMDRGLWRYTRHPNYFGDFMVWWGYYLIAVAAGGWWSIWGPLVMSWLLLRVSGVAMLEKTISKRRPGYEEYVRATNAFFPGPPKSIT